MKPARIVSAFLSLGLFAVTVCAQQPPAKTPPGKAGKAPAESAAAPAKPAASSGTLLVAQMPAPSPPRPFQFSKAATRTLANGLRVFVVTDREQPAVSARLVFTAAGSVNDPPGKPGVASMTSNLLDQGTATRSAQQIAQAIDFVGGSLSASANDDGTYIGVTVVKKDLNLGLDLLADVALRAAFKKEELDRRRQQALAGLRVSYNDANFLAGAVFARLVYGSHPYGLPGNGTPESLPKITRDDLAAFRDTWFVPGRALLAFAGDITPEAAFSAAEKFFGPSSWPQKVANATTPPAPAPGSGLRVVLVDKPDAVQTQIRVGRMGIPRNSPDYIPLLVANRVFGGGFNSRLSTEVRQKKGLTYGAYSNFNAERLAGDFVASTFTRTEATVEATRLVVDLIEKMASGEVTPAEMNFARDYLAGVFPIQSETGEQVAGRILTVAQYDLPADYNDTYRERVLSVDAAQVKQMSARYFNPANLQLVLVGNVKEFRDGIQKAFPSAKFDEIRFDEVDILAADLRKPKPAAAAASPESVARAKDLIAAAAQAAGGAAIASIQSVEFSGKAEANTPQGPLTLGVKLTVAFPDRARQELTLPFGTVLVGGDGASAWISTPQGIQDLPADFAKENLRTAALAAGWGFFQQAAGGSLNVTFAGEEEVEGKKLLAVNWVSPAGSTKLYFDPQSGMLVGARYLGATLQGPADTLELWSDFRAVNGAQFPYRQVNWRNGQKEAELTITEVKVNTNPDAALFKKPQ